MNQHPPRKFGMAVTTHRVEFEMKWEGNTCQWNTWVRLYGTPNPHYAVQIRSARIEFNNRQPWFTTDADTTRIKAVLPTALLGAWLEALRHPACWLHGNLEPGAMVLQCDSEVGMPPD
jgi:hypothetical protein